MTWFEFVRSSGAEYEYFIAPERMKSWYVMSILVLDQSGAQNEIRLQWSSIPAQLIRLENQQNEGDPNENSLVIAVDGDSQKGVPMRAEKMQHINITATGAYEIHFDVIEADLSRADMRLLEFAILDDVLTTGENPFQRIIETDDN